MVKEGTDSEQNAGAGGQIDPLVVQLTEKEKTIGAVDVFILMIRHGSDYWQPLGAYRTAEEAQKGVPVVIGIECWRVVKAAGMPINVPAGAV